MLREYEISYRRMWRNMSLDESIPESNRSNYVVWDYPLQDKYIKMYLTMEEIGFIPSVKEAVKMVRNINRTQEFAFIGEAMTIKYLILTDCNFKQVGKEFNKKPFAFALQKDSPLKLEIDDAITRLAIEGRLKALEKKWWDENPLKMNCPAEKSFNTGFDLDNLAVVFLLIILGIFLAVFIISIEYYWYRCHLQRTVAKVRHFSRSTLAQIKRDE
ncbi:Ionotropic receptor 25a [Anthophora plagiata]